MVVTSRAGTGRARSLVQITALVIGVVFLLVGVLGFVPGITENSSSIAFAGHHSDAKLLGLFQVSILHNIVHLLFGVAGVAMARTASAARFYLISGGAIYLVLWVYGLVIGQDTAANVVPINPADNWLHLGLGIGMIALGVATSRQRQAVPA